ncbi:hypothetical protein A3B32_02320 [Candidatus Uhrbacteria bacterium RIFCSPLOWO2_01_FULL_53_9]|uniref:NTP pyrophosphohydrolase MazG-like domain-containing protein n=3 Tax=Candidatus Uhriibacteriota TaxID=1752732 RepID=A0A1F7UYJ8_9BACT|nr:MAG: hypothetical protein A3C17_01245 [Candidatus Uhrbacteria bacterium RIFCSPHIGHO2_02_FULL_53_13]OGL83306.1 MAG: hypothetical protein A3B32_02320 [Candidatus Uhrbacteria bacterium RIFCSPLOWO2_01_FULL_53_9]OGL88927.1 MAG: hypothetical protein A3I45_01420 [Candidatus Uhrbacteria bacterium RIFCSPLOWO2_02_FULL_53_10]
MTFQEYQRESRKTAIYPLAGTNLVYPVLGLVGEAGEIANKVKKIQRDDQGVLSEERRQALREELGDVLWYLSQVATELDVDLDEIATDNLAKLFSRKDRGVLHGSGDQR